MRKNENAGGGTLKNLKNPIPLLLTLSLVSCHPARVVTESGEVHRIGRYVLMTHAIRREAA